MARKLSGKWDNFPGSVCARDVEILAAGVENPGEKKKMGRETGSPGDEVCRPQS